MLFEEIEFENLFDGIWACVSLLHVRRGELGDILLRLNKALKKNGILYMSFKYGSFGGYRDDRYYTDINEEDVKKLVGNSWELIKYYISGDTMGDRDGIKWMNVFARKT